MREVEIGVERGTAPDTPGLDSPMGQWGNSDEIGRFAILKQQCDVGLERRLIAFNGEVVMRLALHHIGCQFALR